MTTTTTTTTTAATTTHPATPQTPTLNPTDQFPDLPPFPPTLRTAPLVRLSLKTLLSPSSSSPESLAESASLFRAAKDLGFFYLDLRGVEVGEQILADAERLFGVGAEVFGLEGGVKDGFDWSSEGSYFG